MVSNEDLVGLRAALIVLDSRRELVLEDVVRVVPFISSGIGVGGEVEEEHAIPVLFLDDIHVVANLVEEDCGGLGVAILGRGDSVV